MKPWRRQLEGEDLLLLNLRGVAPTSHLRIENDLEVAFLVWEGTLRLAFTIILLDVLGPGLPGTLLVRVLEKSFQQGTIIE